MSMYGWLYSLDQLAGGDGTKWLYYERISVMEFLNRLSFLKAKNEWEIEKQRRAIDHGD